MISYIKGELVEIIEDLAIIDSKGFGIEVHIPLTLVGELSGKFGTQVKLYTYFRLYEDNMSLYGFGNRRDLDMFKLLISVNGIGPKVALGALSSIQPDDLRMAIMADDAKTISKAQGIGSKMAKRIILDLKDKISIADIAYDIDREISDKNVFNKSSDTVREAIEALVGLGYSQTDATKVIASVDTKDMAVEDVLKEALKRLSFL